MVKCRAAVVVFAGSGNKRSQVLALFDPIAVGLVEVVHDHEPGIDAAGVVDAFGDVVIVAFAVGSELGVADLEVEPALDDEAPLGFVRVLGQVDVFGELHEDDLLVFCLGEVSFDSPEGNIGFRQTGHYWRKVTAHVLKMSCLRI